MFWGQWRVQGQLAVSRALGDANLKKFVICSPDVIVHARVDADMFVVLASDGLWDVLSRQQVADFVLKHVSRGTGAAAGEKAQFAVLAKELCLEATLLGSTDNITVQIIDLRKRKIIDKNVKTKK